MEVSEATLDDLLRAVLEHLIAHGNQVTPTKGANREIIGACLTLTNPRARLSRTENRGHLFSALGEYLWYLAGTNRLDFIEYYIPRYRQYSDDGKTIYGGYGLRLRRMHGQYDQIRNVISLLRDNRATRRAVVSLFDAEDIVEPHEDIPCTCTLQFLIRDLRVHLLVHMRSNDAYIGLPHDIFAFTMLQELAATSMGLDVGTYVHMVGSLHLYEMDVEKARSYLNEGWQERVAMPAMPLEDPWPSLQTVLQAEARIRNGPVAAVIEEQHVSSEYWCDLIRLLQILRLTRAARFDQARNVETSLTTEVFSPYVEARYQQASRGSPS